MKLFQQTIDNNVGVYDGDTHYVDTADNFLADYGSIPALPEGIEQRLYEPDVRHALSANSGARLEGGPMPWPEGDAIIAVITDLLAAQSARLAASPPFAPKLDMGGNIKTIIGE